MERWPISLHGDEIEENRLDSAENDAAWYPVYASAAETNSMEDRLRPAGAFLTGTTGIGDMLCLTEETLSQLQMIKEL